jgi:hypothetical protein
VSGPLACLLELRLRFWRSPEACALVDRGLVLAAQANACHADLDALDLEVTRLADDLALRFGAPAKVTIQ